MPLKAKSRLKRLLGRLTGTPSKPAAGWVEVERRGLRWRLCLDRYLDREVFERGAFEPATTHRMECFVRPGMRVIDIGANFGYYTTLLARLVGPAGHVWAFEPTQHYGRRIHEHLALNHLADRVTVLDYGLSDRTHESRISIDESSATLHQAAAEISSETARFRTLDEVAPALGIDRVDFVKIDTDGHEPAVLRGAAGILRRFHPVVAIEFSQANLDLAGSDVRHLRQQLEELGYALHSEITGGPYASRRQFLVECGNFTHSANVWAYPLPAAVRAAA